MRRRGWACKFRCAFHGVRLGIAGQPSFLVHLPVAAVVIAAGVFFRVSAVQWSLLATAIATVLVTELVNSSIESLARAVTEEEHPQIGAALDIASGAVLLSAMGAVAVGLIVFLPHFLALFTG